MRSSRHCCLPRLSLRSHLGRRNSSSSTSPSSPPTCARSPPRRADSAAPPGIVRIPHARFHPAQATHPRRSETHCIAAHFCSAGQPGVTRPTTTGLRDDCTAPGPALQTTVHLPARRRQVQCPPSASSTVSLGRLAAPRRFYSTSNPQSSTWHRPRPGFAFSQVSTCPYLALSRAAASAARALPCSARTHARLLHNLQRPPHMPVGHIGDPLF